MTLIEWFEGLLLLAALVTFLGAVSALLWSEYPSDREHVPSPEDGCCGCGAGRCDVLVGPRWNTEPYCWSCIDSWPVDARTLEYFGMSVLPGRERADGAR